MCAQVTDRRHAEQEGEDSEGKTGEKKRDKEDPAKETRKQQGVRTRGSMRSTQDHDAVKD